MVNPPEATTSPRRPTKLPSPTASPYRPRLSPRDENGASGPGATGGGASDFFAVPPSPARNEASSSQFGFGGQMSAAEGAAKWASLQSGLPTGTGGHSGFNFGGGQSPPSSAPSTSPAAFSRFARPSLEAIRGPSTVMGSPTPLEQPSAPSPFFPSSTSTASSFPPFNSGSTASPASTSTFSLPRQSSFSFSQSPAISLPTSSRPPQQSSAVRLNANSNPRYTQLAPSQLVELLTSSNSSAVLVLDLRTHTAHVQGRLRRSVSICVPSTLLRRPAYGIDRVAESLSPSEQAIFNDWKSASTIVALDMDSNSVADGTPIVSLLAKFEKAGFAGQLVWIKGGWNAVRAEVKASGAAAKALLDSGEKAPSGDDFSAPSSSPAKGGASLSHSTSIGKKHARPVLQVRDLPVSAFQAASTSAFAHAGAPSSSMNIGGRPTGESSRGDSRPGLGKRRKSGNEGFGLTLDMQSHPDGQMPPTPGLESTGEKRMATNPFFDNIRQNSEALSLERSLAHLSPVELAAVPAALTAFLPPYLSRLLQLSPIQRAELLARQFYELEVAERERLEGTLNWHATVQGKENDNNVEAQRFKKFGISAGVELGSLNRFKNIFPYDHSRVRLHKYASGATDYINASHIKLEGSSKRYIASQGPLPTTYHDFWQLCDQEQVGVIVMVTNLHEGGREKCGRYWMCGSDGDWIVKAVGGEEEDVEHTEKVPERQQGGFFAPTQAEPEVKPADQASTIRRTIQVQRKDEVGQRPPRKIRHIQYRAWPDFDVPAAPQDVVELVREAEAAQAEYLREIDWQGEVEPPIVTHCSAGCGRTGVFILVSTILERMRKDREAARKEASAQSIKSTVDVVDSMEIDSPLSTTTAGTGKDSQPSTNPFEFPESVGTSQTNTHTFSPPPAFPPFPRMASTTPSSLIPQTASLSLAPDARPMLVHHSSQSPPIASPFAPVSTPLPLDPASSSESTVPALASADPIFAGVNDLRTQRMSMVANYRQYVSIHECVLVGAVKAVEDELEQMRRLAGQA
ncbi:hypothetical protein BCR35DRAFT_300780 [Leucosporidium creatinivorum]|uniref:protein-tyrosine-phosphatase n=1 Tax=Leucosporidium creatinivorum TaxID=106004 RepID=A0A1Y2FY61_9BASI|nr:hypothetical protein BCR35DRAFT_300780 [Leucosporidium creatinivorum]